MTPFFDDGQVTLHLGHTLDVLRELPSESVQCVVTSPPYWALRSYGTEPQVWSGGWRGELGHEPTPQMFVAHLVDIFREVRRVLKSDGVCFVNIGDSYSGSGKGPSNSLQRPASSLNNGQLAAGAAPKQWIPVPPGTKPKDLVLIPERFALAMQDVGWYVRSRIAWCKRAPMPESVKDRPTNAWEHVWMFTKSERYFWAREAVRESLADANGQRTTAHYNTAERYGAGNGGNGGLDALAARMRENGHAGRNMWNYWLLSPDPEPLAHFATFPREIPRRCIAAATREGDTVLDPFVGSGTTCQVARSMLRRSIGIDLNEAYLRDIALKKNAQMALMDERRAG